MTQAEIEETLRLHALWLEGDESGEEAYLRAAYLYGVDLQRAYLQAAYLYGADLQRAERRWADLRAAYLHGADLQ